MAGRKGLAILMPEELREELRRKYPGIDASSDSDTNARADSDEPWQGAMEAWGECGPARCASWGQGGSEDATVVVVVVLVSCLCLWCVPRLVR